jgi:hypothetical protein
VNQEKNARLYMLGGACGITGTACYIFTITIRMNNIAQYALAMAWPVLSIIFAFAIFRYIGSVRQSTANQLSFLFACLGFSMVACMLSVQMAVGITTADFIAESPDKVELLKLLKRSLRSVDFGMDVVWDFFIGTSLIFLSAAILSHPHFRFWWSILAALLGLSLIILNVITFPYPPHSKGLFDIGPGIGIYIIALSARLLWLGNRMKNTQ